MVNQKHFDILRQEGVDVWNQCRKEHPDTKPDLSGADLYKATLSGANLRDADLSNAILVKTILRQATLINCRVYGISAWDIELEGAKQDSLVISDYNKPS